MRFLNVSHDSDLRYDVPRFADHTENVVDVLDSYIFEKVRGYYREQVELKNLSVDGIFEVTTQEHRPDLISYEIYEDTQYWWLLMEFNDIIDIFAIVSGVQMKYFKVSELEDIYFSLSSRQRQQDR